MSQTDSLEERFRELEREVMSNKQQPTSDNPNKRAEPEFVAIGQGVDVAKNSLGGLIGLVNGLTGATKVVATVVIGLVAFTILSFASGNILENTFVFRTVSCSSASGNFISSSPVILLSYPLKPTCCAIAAVVAALSPVIIFTEIPAA